MEKKRYWLKLNKDFLKSPHIKVIKNMTNGKDYVIFYLALMLESIETVGHLRFSELVPYNASMLSALTDTNVDIVKSAVKIFEELGLIEVLDDGTIYLNQVAALTGKECDSAERVRRFRLKDDQKALQSNTDVTNCNDNKEKEEEKEKDKQRRKKREEKEEKGKDWLAAIPPQDKKIFEEKYQKIDINEEIEKAINWLNMTGKRYKNYKAFLDNWLKKANGWAKEKAKIETDEVRIPDYLKEFERSKNATSVG